MKFPLLLGLSILALTTHLASANEPAMVLFGLSGDCGCGKKLKPDQYILLDLYQGGLFSHENRIPDESVAAYIDKVLSTKESPDHVPVLIIIHDDITFGGVVRAAEAARKSRVKMISMVPQNEWKGFFPKG